MPKTSRTTLVYPITLREVEVARVEDLTPGLRRVTVTGPQLGSFTTESGLELEAFRSQGFDDAVRLFFPYPGQSEPVLPVQKPGNLEFGRDPRPLSKVYTVRRWDPADLEIDLDFVKHGTGVATTWAYRATPGDRIHLASPSNSLAFPAAADWLIVIGDDTALPAIARLLEELPSGIRAQVFVEVAHAAHRLELPVPDGVELTWLTRDGAPAGESHLLLDAVRAATWWPGQPYAWIAGETGVVRDLRRHLIDDRGMPKVDLEFTGYWKATDVVTVAGDPTMPDPDKNPEAFEKLHELSELAPPLAIRTTVELGIPDAIARGATTVPALSEATRTDAVALGKLLRYLQAIEILEQPEPGHYRLSPAGDYLLADFVIDILHPDGAGGRQTRALHGLTESVRTGRSSYASLTGQDYPALRREQWFENKLGESVAGFAPYLVEPLVASGVLDGHGHVVVHSDGAGTIARSLVTRDEAVRVTVAALPSHLTWLGKDLPDAIPDAAARERVTLHEQSAFEPSPAADALVLVKLLSQYPDADAARILRQATVGQDPSLTIVVLDDVFDTSELDEHDAEADLLNLALHGSGNRTDEEWRTLFAAAGLAVADTRTVGWGFTVYLLRPQPSKGTTV